jgi:hypothetical protein
MQEPQHAPPHNIVPLCLALRLPCSRFNSTVSSGTARLQPNSCVGHNEWVQLVTIIVLLFDQLSMGRSSKDSLGGICTMEKIESDVRSHMGDASAKLAATIRSLRSLLVVVTSPRDLSPECCSMSSRSSSATSTDLRRTVMSRSCRETVQNFCRQVGQGFSWLPATAAEP